MQHAPFVDRVHGTGDLLHQERGPPVRQRPGLEGLFQAAPLHVAHGVEGPPVVSADLIDRHHARVGDAGRGLPFRAEAAQPLAALVRVEVLQPVPADELQRDETVGAPLAGEIDDPHAAAPQLAEDFVARELAAGRQVGRRVGRRGGACGRRGEMRRESVKAVAVAEERAQRPFQVRVLPNGVGQVERLARLLRQQNLGQHLLETGISRG